MNMVVYQHAQRILDLYLKYGNEVYFGENVTQIQHATQAAQLAKNHQYNNEVVLAAFLHDIGHLLSFDNPSLSQMGDYGALNHESIGANYLRSIGFSDFICDLVESHVAAKRYLIYQNPEYYLQLSEASKKTLEHQGGMMTLEEAILFSENPHFDLYIKMRQWDEMAKCENDIQYDLKEIHQLIIGALTS